MQINAIQAAQPQFGQRYRTNLTEEEKKLLGLGAMTASITAAPSLAATAAAGSATATAGSGLKTAGTGLLSTGPQSSAAAFVLDIMTKLGSGGAAAWSAVNPIAGGLIQIVLGSILSGGGSSSAKSSGSKCKKPS
jgi:hypothetical protein